MKRATYIYSVPFTMTVISIHALVKRATCQILDYCVFKAISIHALVKRATSASIAFASAFAISIHALVKRATDKFGEHIHDSFDFNPRPREEGD